MPEEDRKRPHRQLKISYQRVFGKREKRNPSQEAVWKDLTRFLMRTSLADRRDPKNAADLVRYIITQLEEEI